MYYSRMVLWKKVATAFAQACFIHVVSVHQNIRICHFSSLKNCLYQGSSKNFIPFPPFFSPLDDALHDPLFIFCFIGRCFFIINGGWREPQQRSLEIYLILLCSVASVNTAKVICMYLNLKLDSSRMIAVQMFLIHQ